ncbi:hypothetical protein [uncultured Paraglaciecola sp.]|uniref:hypothetical protein n=1 Tax=uncultured Paraglaciecola sp. TaxID=1765024 RepID=UPI00261448C8|nr:hypothetical protein [uncultured Paraglaciecola sp.]
MKAYGIDQGMQLETIPIETVGKSFAEKYWTWLMDQRRVRVIRPFHVPRPNGGTYILPSAFDFDGGSIPRWLLVLAVIANQIFPLHGWAGYTLMAMILIGLMIERFGLMLAAFAVHDFAVRYGVLITGDGRVEEVPNVSAANSVMRRVNFATNDMILLGWVAHIAVVLGAWRAWSANRKTKPAVDWRSLDYGMQLQLDTL